jgi:uncharacterized membrane protein
LRLLLGRMVRSLWFTPAAFALAALAALALAPALSPLVPPALAELIGLDGVYDLLDALASSLLAVAIFSLGIMVSSIQAAASAATPRARPLIVADRTAQTAISTFIGGFIFGIVGIVGLSTDLYNDASRVVLFAVTCLVVLAVIVTLIRWIARLGRLGDVGETVDLAEAAAERCFAEVARAPHLGGRPAVPLPAAGAPVHAGTIGFVQAIDAERLGALAADEQVDLHVTALPGAWVDPARPLAVAGRRLGAEAEAAVRAAFVVGGSRTFERDPRFALVVLSEIGSKALSPGVNDPGTAIDVVGTLVRVLAGWRAAVAEAGPEVRHPRLFAPGLAVEDLMVDAFRAIARDGAAMLEVQTRVQKALGSLVAVDAAVFAGPARAMAREALERAEAAMLPADLERLRTVARAAGMA